jgi:hypothetical protein
MFEINEKVFNHKETFNVLIDNRIQMLRREPFDRGAEGERVGRP